MQFYRDKWLCGWFRVWEGGPGIAFTREDQALYGYRAPFLHIGKYRFFRLKSRK